MDHPNPTGSPAFVVVVVCLFVCLYVCMFFTFLKSRQATRPTVVSLDQRSTCFS